VTVQLNSDGVEVSYMGESNENNRQVASSHN
jgi:hypothetical protein